MGVTGKDDAEVPVYVGDHQVDQILVKFWYGTTAGYVNGTKQLTGTSVLVSAVNGVEMAERSDIERAIGKRCNELGLPTPYVYDYD